MERKGLVAAAILTALLMTGCGPGEKYRDHGDRVLMEASRAEWTQEAAFWGLERLGRPYGTTWEESAFDPEKELWQISFDLKEPVTQALMDGYAQAVWNACLRADGGQLESSSGFCYDRLGQAEREQEPLNYYIWYYHAGNKRYRVGLYSSDMAAGRSGGLVLEIQRWN